jgi:hypothetical protein
MADFRPLSLARITILRWYALSVGETVEEVVKESGFLANAPTHSVLCPRRNDRPFVKSTHLVFGRFKGTGQTVELFRVGKRSRPRCQQ